MRNPWQEYYDRYFVKPVAVPGALHRVEPYGSNVRVPVFAPIEPVGCAHAWKDYVGFTEAYKFCEKCDQKEFAKK